MNHTLAAVGALFASSVSINAAMAGDTPPAAPPPLRSVGSGELAQGPFSSMHMTLQKTILRINVANVEVRVDKMAQRRLAEVLRGQRYSDALEQQLAPIAIGADRANVRMEFTRDVPLKRWIDVVRENLGQARAAGLIAPALEERVGRSLPQWFSALRDRGYQKGDILQYDLGPNWLRTMVASASGELLVDRTEHDRDTRGVVLASYFAPNSDFRGPLLRSLLEPQR